MDTASLAKVELHCHLDGLLDPAMLRGLREQGHALPISAEALEAASPVRTAAGWAAWARVAADPLRGRLDLYRPIIAAHVARLKAQRVEYAEVMISPSEIPRDSSEAVERVGAFREWVSRQEGGAIRVELLMALNRRRDPEVVDAQATLALALFERGLIVGVALAGPEPGHPVGPLRRIFARLHASGIGIEIHAGEWGGPESVRDALAHGQPDRIGHGVGLFEDARLVQEVKERGIHLELCPTSNLATGSVARLEEHPVGRARELGLSFSVSTDDPGPFGCSMNSEYALLVGRFGFRAEDFEALRAAALRASFGPRRRTTGPSPSAE